MRLVLTVLLLWACRRPCERARRELLTKEEKHPTGRALIRVNPVGCLFASDSSHGG